MRQKRLINTAHHGRARSGVRVVHPTFHEVLTDDRISLLTSKHAVSERDLTRRHTAAGALRAKKPMK
jgi:hypothetical protein